MNKIITRMSGSTFKRNNRLSIIAVSIGLLILGAQKTYAFIPPNTALIISENIFGIIIFVSYLLSIFFRDKFKINSQR